MYDAVLLVSFGGPERPQDVLPFLENVTRGRPIPRERLLEVAEHYFRFGGASPINAQNRALLAALERDFATNGVDAPIYWGNRNWTPYLADALRAMTRDGVRRALCVFTSAYASYSGCRQYRENLADALAEVGPGAPLLDKVRHYFNLPGFVEPTVDAAIAAHESLPEPSRQGARLVFVTHSIPVAMARSSGPQGNAYVRQHLDVAQTVAAGVEARTGAASPWDLVYCSRSGPPGQAWLEPDINDYLRALPEKSRGDARPGVVVVPIGFVSDHMEVRFDLDTEARETALEVGLPFARAATVGTDARFVAGLRKLVLERDVAEEASRAAPATLGTLGPSHDVCPAGCCPNPRGDRPAACGG